MIVNSKEEMVKLNGQKKILDKDTIILIFSSNCGPCHMFIPIWKDFVKKNKNSSTNTIAIEVNYLKDVSNDNLSNTIKQMYTKKPYVPNVAKYDCKTGKVHILEGNLTFEKLNSVVTPKPKPGTETNKKEKKEKLKKKEIKEKRK